MIQRRHFLGSAAAIVAASGTALSGSQSLFGAAALEPRSLNWQCQIIQTQPLNRAQRAPVVTGVSLQPNGSLMSIVGDDHHVSIFDFTEDKFVHHLDKHTDWVRAAKFDGAGTRLATAGNDRKLLIWDASDWRAPSVVKRHPEAIINLAFSNDGTKLATVGFGESLRIYNVTSGAQLRTLTCACKDNHAIAFSNDDRYVAAGGRCGSIRVWDMESGQLVSEYKPHRKRVRTLEFADDGRLVSAGDDQQIFVANIRNANAAKKLPKQASKLYDLRTLPGGLIASGGSDNKIHIWQLSDGQQVGSLKGHTGTVTCLDIENEKLASGSYDTQVRVWTMEQNTSAPRQRTTNFGSGSGWNRKLK